MKLLSVPLALVAFIAVPHVSLAQIAQLAAQAAAASSATAASPSPQLGIDINNFDPEVRPQDNFYRAINGAWLEATEIPADKSNYGTIAELLPKCTYILQPKVWYLVTGATC